MFLTVIITPKYCSFNQIDHDLIYYDYYDLYDYYYYYDFCC